MKIALAGGAAVRDLTGPDLRDAILALKAVDAAVANDSGLLHVAAAVGAPVVGIFGPTGPVTHGPLNPLAAADRAEPRRVRNLREGGLRAARPPAHRRRSGRAGARGGA